MTKDLSKCPRCGAKMSQMSKDIKNSIICEKCGVYKHGTQEFVFSYGLIVIEKKKYTGYMPVINKEDLPELSKAILGKKSLRIFNNNMITVESL